MTLHKVSLHQIKQATLIDTRHIHGSLFVYEWRLTTTEGNVYFTDTINEYEECEVMGSTINIDKSNIPYTFTVVRSDYE